jgi:transcriptional regulator with XRE-family HTH domain
MRGSTGPPIEDDEAYGRLRLRSSGAPAISALEGPLMTDLATALGIVLREARLSRRLTLRDVQEASGGGFRVSTLAGYERAERMLTLERFCELAALYGLAPEELLTRVLDERSRGSRRSVVIDLSRLEQVHGEPGEILARFVHEVRTRRSDLRSNVISLRTGDLEALALGSGHGPAEFLRALEPVDYRP